MTRSTRQRERTRETDETEEQEGNVPAPSVNRTISSRTPTGESSSAKTVGSSWRRNRSTPARSGGRSITRTARKVPRRRADDPDDARQGADDDDRLERQGRLRPLDFFEKRSQMHRLRKWQERIRTKDAGERNLQFALSEIDRMASALGVPRSVREVASVIYRRALKEDLIRGRSIEGVATSALYAACRKEGIPRSLEEISEVSRVERKEIGRTYRYISQELGLEMRPVDPKSTSRASVLNSNCPKRSRPRPTKSSRRRPRKDYFRASHRRGTPRPRSTLRPCSATRRRPSARSPTSHR